jgi:hypothetical protein
MTHENAGHYAKKHPADREAKKEIVQAVKQKALYGEISCSAAHKIAASLAVPVEEVGFVVDHLEIRLVKCQLGLYGYRPEKRVVKPAKTVSKALEDAIKESLAEERLSCTAAWDIAKRFGIARMDVSSACEALKIKIFHCQLGAF